MICATSSGSHFPVASATVAVGLVLMVALLGATVILWEIGTMPVFTD